MKRAKEKSFLAAPVASLIQSFDFVKFFTKISQMEPGATYVREHPLVPAFDNQAEIARLAVDLTERALSEKGENISRKELEGQAEIISCRYDASLHDVARGGLFNCIGTLFQSQSQDRFFTSADNRELRHLPRLLEAKEKGHGVVYLINHSSHLDEFLLNLFLDQNGLGLPLFAAGQNMMATPSLSKVLMLGSYVIVRTGASRSYLSTLFHYCQSIGENCRDQGIFLEAWSGGARTRDGSLRYPRRLIALQGALAARNDVFVQPVVISYSRVPEDLGLSEGKGIGSWITGHHIFKEVLKKPWNFREQIFKGVKNLFGRTYVGFGEGRYLSDLAHDMAEDKTDLALDEYVSLYAIKEIARDKKIMASQLAARALMKARRKKDLLTAAQSSLDEIMEYHQETFQEDADLEDFIRNHNLTETIDDGLNSLRMRKIVGRKKIFSKKLPKILAPHALSYYATHSDRRLYSPSAKENFVICGASPWGFALAFYLGQRTLSDRKFHNSSLTLYDSEKDVIQSLIYDRTFDALFPDQRLPKNIFPTTDHKAAFRKATEVVVTAAPGRVENILKTIIASAPELKSLIIASRGFDALSHRLPMQMAWEAAVASGRQDLNIMALSSPFSPEHLFNQRGGTWILAGTPRKGKDSEVRLFKWDKFEVFTCPDPIGVETAAAMADIYTLYGAFLNRWVDFYADPISVSKYVREISAETKTLAEALGGDRQTFEADNPAWVAEYLTRALSLPHTTVAKLVATKGPQALKNYMKNRGSDELWPDSGASGYFSTHSAYLTAKHLGLNLPHLEAANEVFWG